MTNSSDSATSKVPSPGKDLPEGLPKGLPKGLAKDLPKGSLDASSESVFSTKQPTLYIHHARANIWRKLYAWAWVVTLSVIGFTFFGFSMLPPHSFSENFSDGRPQVSIRIDRLLAILRGQVVANSEGEVISMIPSLLETTEIYGMLPSRSPDGDQPWRAYRSRTPVVAGRGKIVVIVSGLGLDQQITEQAIDMPAAVTLEFSPYGRSLGRWALFAREKGHELLLSLPVEGFPDSGIDAGNLQLSVKHGVPENIHRLKSALGRMTGYVGVSSGHISPFFADQTVLVPVLQDLATRGLLFLDAGSLSPQALSRSLSQPGSRGLFSRGISRMPLARLDLSIEQAQTREELDLALQKIMSGTRRKSAATIIRFAPLPATLEALNEWLITLDSSRSHQVIPLSAVFSASTGKQRRF